MQQQIIIILNNNEKPANLFIIPVDVVQKLSPAPVG